LRQATGLQQGMSDNDYERVPVKRCPRAALHAFEPEFFLQLLVRLLANPSGFGGSRKLSERAAGRQVGQGVLFRSPVERCSPARQPLAACG
jgi:hypothetical protein